MRVDPARRDQKPVGGDVALGRALLAADCGDAAVGDGNIARECGLAGAVDNGTAANDDVVHGRRSLKAFGIRLWSVGPDSEIHTDSLCMMHLARQRRNAVIAQCWSLLMQVFANAGLCQCGLCGAMDKPGKEPAYNAAFVVWSFSVVRPWHPLPQSGSASTSAARLPTWRWKLAIADTPPRA